MLFGTKIGRFGGHLGIFLISKRKRKPMATFLYANNETALAIYLKLKIFGVGLVLPVNNTLQQFCVVEPE